MSDVVITQVCCLLHVRTSGLLDYWIACFYLMSPNCVFGVFTFKHLSKQKRDGDGRQVLGTPVSERWSNSSQCPFPVLCLQCRAPHPSVLSAVSDQFISPLSDTKALWEGHPCWWFVLCGFCASPQPEALLCLTVLSATPHH